jgi:hypothetical protein
VIRRLHYFLALLGLAGTMGFGFYLGWHGAAGFALGALASWWNFLRLRALVETLGTATSDGLLGAVAWMLFRFILLVLGAFVILKFTKISLPAAAAGLFLSVGAVVLETIFETTYER